MRVESKKALFLGHIPPPHHGAAIIGEKVLSVMQELYDVSVFKVNVSTNIAEIGKASKSTLVFFLVRLVKDVIISLFKRKPSLVYLTPSLNGAAFYRDLVLMMIFYLYAFVTKSRIVCHIHMRPLILERNNLLNALWNLLTRRFEVILLSSSLKLDYSNSFKPIKIHYLNNAIDEIPCKNFSISSQVRTVLYIGHLLRSKGAFRVLELANEFRKENIVFKIAGEFGGESERLDFLQEIDALELKNIELLGRVEGDNKATLFHTSDVLLLPSYSEAQPLTILEAFSCGLPVLATPVGGIVDILDEETGRCVPFEDFSEALESILSKGRDHFSKRCREKYQSSFTNKSFVDNCKAILR
ncbi:glycosyltransferase family 4 protein [Vibrio navarrensis]|uniref:glycosyltransferase family 4 protein n=1 Tax=Vibrio navarrensis TaxID=29495 RepID=UPI001869D9F4|nr:glycosyltransferase family 4 protein [Vibrio navarrensis]MBE4582237.1 hypothetical protein [Vibrio navarrensis]